MAGRRRDHVPPPPSTTRRPRSASPARSTTGTWEADRRLVAARRPPRRLDGRRGRRPLRVPLPHRRRRWFNDESADDYVPNEFGGVNCVVDVTSGVDGDAIGLLIRGGAVVLMSRAVARAPHVPGPLPRCADRRRGAAVRADDLHADPPRPQRRHHRQGHRHRRHRLHLARRGDHARRHARPGRVRHRRRVLRLAHGDGLRAGRPQRPVPPGHRLLGPGGRRRSARRR